jgi:hypothetical protein
VIAEGIGNALWIAFLIFVIIGNLGYRLGHLDPWARKASPHK